MNMCILYICSYVLAKVNKLIIIIKVLEPSEGLCQLNDNIFKMEKYENIYKL